MGRSLKNHMDSYRAYHQSSKNRMTHFFGIPLVTCSLFIFLGWFRFAPVDIPVSAGTIAFLGVFIYYLKLNPAVGFVTGMWMFPLFILAEEIAVSRFALSGIVCLATFIVGMAFQLLGHYFEGKRPAFMDNFLQVFNGPLLLTTEVMGFVGYQYGDK